MSIIPIILKKKRLILGSNVNQIPAALNPTKTVTWGAYDDVSLDDSGNVQAFFDKIAGKNTFGSELSSGNATYNMLYQITATTANYFFSGCKVGDYYVGVGTTSLTVNCKVKQIIGNHLCESIRVWRATLGTNEIIFDGSDDRYTTLPITLIQPVKIYLVLRQITWKNGGSFADGISQNKGNIQQLTSSPNISAYAGISSPLVAAPLDEYMILRVLFNGANSYIQINEGAKTTWNCGTQTMGGFSLGGYTPYSSNMGLKEFIVQREDSVEDDAAIYAYLKKKITL